MASIKSTLMLTNALQMLNIHVGLTNIKTLLSNDPPASLVSAQASNAWCLQLEPHLAKGVFFSERANSFFKSPNLQNKNIPKNYPELEI